MKSNSLYCNLTMLDTKCVLDYGNNDVTYRWFNTRPDNTDSTGRAIVFGVHLVDTGSDTLRLYFNGELWDSEATLINDTIPNTTSAVKHILKLAEDFIKSPSDRDPFYKKVGIKAPERENIRLTKKMMMGILSKLNDDDVIEFWNKSDQEYMDCVTWTINHLFRNDKTSPSHLILGLR